MPPEFTLVSENAAIAYKRPQRVNLRRGEDFSMFCSRLCREITQGKEREIGCGQVRPSRNRHSN
jgi:hypothetical protein